jgi:hypothetical protein
MAVYKDAETFYTVMKDLFDQLQAEEPAAFDKLIKQKMSVRFRCAAPAAQVTIDAKTRPPRMTYGAFAGRPDLDVDMTADTLHQLLTHELSTKKAVSDGKVKIKGNPFKMSAMLDVIQSGRHFYPALLKKHKLG